MLYEVLIPSQESNGYDETITVDANNWMVALKSGLERVGEPQADIRNVMCDIKDDNTIHVTDALTRRVFVLRELDPEEDAEIEELRKQAAEAAERAAAARFSVTGVSAGSLLTGGTVPPTSKNSAVKPAPAQRPPEPSVVVNMEQAPAVAPAHSMEDGRMRIGSASLEAMRREEEPAVIVRSERRKTSERPAIGRAAVENVAENILEDIFLEIQTIHESEMPMEDVVAFVMDMAMSKVPAESGAILFADSDGRELYFATARGPKAGEVMEFRVPMGSGIAGFCARQGVSIAISDAPRDARFFRDISDALHYPTHSIVCAPIQFEGRVYGCLELINRSQGSSFSSNEVNALTYIGRQFAEYINRLIMAREKL